jgi:hypothetical protein
MWIKKFIFLKYVFFCVGLYRVLREREVGTDQKKCIPGTWQKWKKEVLIWSYSAMKVVFLWLQTSSSRPTEKVLYGKYLIDHGF